MLSSTNVWTGEGLIQVSAKLQLNLFKSKKASRCDADYELIPRSKLTHASVEVLFSMFQDHVEAEGLTLGMFFPLVPLSLLWPRKVGPPSRHLTVGAPCLRLGLAQCSVLFVGLISKGSHGLDWCRGVVYADKCDLSAANHNPLPTPPVPISLHEMPELLRCMG